MSRGANPFIIVDRPTVTRMAGCRSGFTLIEAMVALLVITVGMIGVAALHGQTLAANRTAIYRSQAVFLAADIADRIRANPNAILAYQGAPAELPCDEPTRDGGASCSPEQMAAFDLYTWQSMLAHVLPGGRGSIAVGAAGQPSAYRISVSWQDPAADAPIELEIDILAASF